MNFTDTLWHLDRVANSGILGVPEKVALQQASSILHELRVASQMPQATAEELKDFYERIAAIIHRVNVL